MSDNQNRIYVYIRARPRNAREKNRWDPHPPVALLALSQID